MATWWELAIPAGAALSGVLVTAAWQSRTTARARAHERGLRLLEQKREAYERLHYSAVDLRELHRHTRAMTKLQRIITTLLEEDIRRKRAHTEAIKVMQSKFDSGDTEGAFADASAMSPFRSPKLKKDLARVEQLSRAEMTAIEHIAYGLPNQRKIEALVTHLGPRRVRATAASLARETHRDMTDDRDFTAALQAFDKAAREDLGTE